MSDEKFTQGEWKIHCNSANAIEVTLDGGCGWSSGDYLCIGVIAGGDIDGDCFNNPEVIANANLISAAPDMYRALEECVEFIMDIADREEEVMLYGKGMEALAKARGEL